MQLAEGCAAQISRVCCAAGWTATAGSRARCNLAAKPAARPALQLVAKRARPLAVRRSAERSCHLPLDSWRDGGSAHCRTSPVTFGSPEGDPTQPKYAGAIRQFCHLHSALRYLRRGRELHFPIGTSGIAGGASHGCGIRYSESHVEYLKIVKFKSIAFATVVAVLCREACSLLQSHFPPSCTPAPPT